jgi:hypothetical protein
VNTLSPSSFGAPKVSVFSGKASYNDADALRQQIEAAINALELAADFITPGDRVVIKPNWVKMAGSRSSRIPRSCVRLPDGLRASSKATAP